MSGICLAGHTDLNFSHLDHHYILYANSALLPNEYWRSFRVSKRSYTNGLERDFVRFASRVRYNCKNDFRFSQDLFTRFRIVTLKETILGGNQWLSENEKLSWTTENNNNTGEDVGARRPPPASTDKRPLNVDPTHILLTPMQIRTFVAEITPNLAWFRYQNN